MLKITIIEPGSFRTMGSWPSWTWTARAKVERMATKVERMATKVAEKMAKVVMAKNLEKERKERKVSRSRKARARVVVMKKVKVMHVKGRPLGVQLHRQRRDRVGFVENRDMWPQNVGRRKKRNLTRHAVLRVRIQRMESVENRRDTLNH